MRPSGMETPNVVAVVGATATGKTALAEGLAEALGAEVICADSRQVFRELEIGSGKPTPAERATGPHHLFDALTLGEPSSAGWYGRASARARTEARSRGALPLLVGGSGLYLRAAERGLGEAPPVAPEVRARLRAELERRGPEALHALLLERDPVAARGIAPRDRQRIVRALEVQEASGRPWSWWRSRPDRGEAGERWILLEPELSAEDLRDRIAARTRWMMAHGLLEETRGIVAGGKESALRDLRAVGYDEALACLQGRLGRDEAEAAINRRTAQLAKRQRTWFRHQAKATRLDARLPPGRLLRAALDALARAGLPVSWPGT